MRRDREDGELDADERRAMRDELAGKMEDAGPRWTGWTLFPNRLDELDSVLSIADGICSTRRRSSAAMIDPADSMQRHSDAP